MVSCRVLLDRQDDSECATAVTGLDGRESLGQTAGTCEEINYGEACGHSNPRARNHMTDVVDRATRSRMMSGIRGRHTKPERRVRSALHASGFRFRLHVGALPGRPDLVLPKFGAVVLVQGCFWHRHKGCPATTDPSSNVGFWRRKFEENVERDARNAALLRRDGWRIATVWECAVRSMTNAAIANTLAEWLTSDRRSVTLPRRAGRAHMREAL